MLKLLFAIVLIAASVSVTLAEPRPYFTEPSLSPDRKEIAFVSGGDIWTVPATGGIASLLVSKLSRERFQQHDFMESGRRLHPLRFGPAD